ncbi:MAG: sel1 repeat family protein [Kiritimatiellae bacterium]|nr:sel1 repeat family protein [Kiritimatiellia bacterium]
MKPTALHPLFPRLRNVCIAFLPAVLAGCVSPDPRGIWLQGRELEGAGMRSRAAEFYQTAANTDFPIAQYDLARLFWASGGIEEQKHALLLWLDISQVDPTNFLFGRNDSGADPAAIASLLELEKAFKNGTCVAKDGKVAEFLFSKAAEIAKRPSVEAWLRKYGGLSESAALERAISHARLPGKSGVVRAKTEFDYFYIRSLIDRDSTPKNGIPAGGDGYELISQGQTADGLTWTFEAEPQEGSDKLNAQSRFVADAGRIMKETYLNSHPGTDPETVFIADKYRRFRGGMFTYQADIVVIGRAEVSLPGFSVSSQTGHGVLRVPCDAARIGNAFAFAQGNIETIVNSQNVLLTTGRKPSSGAHYRVDDVKTIPGADGTTLLEINFTVE